MPCQSERDFVDTVDDFLNLDQCKRLFGLDFGKSMQANSDPGNENLPSNSTKSVDEPLPGTVLIQRQRDAIARAP